MPKIIICSIALNEEKFIRRWAESAKEADAIYLLDTGSTDDTVKIAKECGVIVIETVIKPWHFGNARNYLLERLPKDADWIINMDLDEVIMPGWRKGFDDIGHMVTRIRYNYTWNWKQRFYLENGSDDVSRTMDTPHNEGLIYKGDKIVCREGYAWNNAVHEIMLRTTGSSPELQSFSDDIKICHFADDTKSRSSYLPLLLLDVEQNPNNDRNTYYCARELMYQGRTKESIAMFKRHITMPEAQWDAERSFSMRYLAKMIPNEREMWLLRSCAEYMHGREPWVDLAQHYHDTNNWPACFYAANRALSISNKSDAYLTEAHSWQWAPHDLLALSAARLGLTNLAVKAGKGALEFLPEDKRLKDNLFFYMKEKVCVDIIIPFKSNLSGLCLLVSQLKRDYKVGRIVVVADGENAYNMLTAIPNDVIKLCVPASVGNIHTFWNLGMQILGKKNPIAFINDDISLDDNCMTNLLDVMLRDPSIGLVCPNYATQPSPTDNYDYEVFGVSGSRYDGFGGMAGFCFMLAKDLTPYWKFNEDLKWLAGDNLIVEWVTQVMKRKAIVTHKARCIHADSKTFNDDPPLDWLNQMHRDKLVYQKIQEGIAESKSYE